MTLRKRNRFDRILIGLLIGLILPVILFLIVYLVKYSNTDFTVYLQNIWQLKVLYKLIYLCVLSNLAIFLLFLRIKYERAARGVVMATFIYAFLVLIVQAI
jgi:uncharacterized BrkB/YihY/UPF0761 family membrane protein